MIIQENRSGSKPRRPRLDEATSRDALKEHLQAVLVSGKRAYATDGKILASAPVLREPEEPERVAVAPQAWKEAARLTITPVLILDENESRVQGGPAFPNPAAHVHKLDELCSKTLDQGLQDVALLVGIDAKLVSRLSKALGADWLFLWVPRSSVAEDGPHPYVSGPIVVSTNDPEFYGVLMPIAAPEAPMPEIEQEEKQEE